MSDKRTFVLPKLLRRDLAICSIVESLQDLTLEDAWRVEIVPHRSVRSDAQNNYLNGVAYKIIGDAIGYERDEVSEFLCGLRWGWKEKKVPKKPSCPEGIESVPIRTTTRDEHGNRSVLSKLQFSDYVAFVQRFAASKGIHVPDPDPNFSDHREESEEERAA